MRAVLAEAFKLGQQLDVVVLIIAVGVAHAIHAAALRAVVIHAHVKTVVRVEQTLRLADFNFDRIDLDRLAIVRKGDAIK